VLIYFFNWKINEPKVEGNYPHVGKKQVDFQESAVFWRSFVNGIYSIGRGFFPCRLIWFFGWFFIGEICILIRDFWVIFKNYSMRMLSILGNDFIACEHTRNRFHRMLSIRGTNFRACSASGKMWTFLHVQSMLSIRGTNFNAHWAYGELIPSHAEHAGNRFHRMLSMRGNV
jgi:hypothetical protein